MIINYLVSLKNIKAEIDFILEFDLNFEFVVRALNQEDTYVK